MKSVKDPPPKNFADQFLKDLKNDEVNNLNQIRWYFNGEKLGNTSEEELVQIMTDAVRSIDFSITTNSDVLDKFQVADVDDLVLSIVSNQIFQKK